MTTEIQNALLIHNPNAGNGGQGRRTMLDEARRIFAAGGIQTDLAETTKAGDATEMAQRANDEGRQLVIACGGDGTLNEVVNGLAGQKNGHRVPLALLRGGNARSWSSAGYPARARFAAQRTRKEEIFSQRRRRRP